MIKNIKAIILDFDGTLVESMDYWLSLPFVTIKEANIPEPEGFRDYIRSFGALGWLVLLGLQTMLIVGGNTKLLPLTGVTLPLVSYGGSSLVSLYAMLGLVSGVYARPAATSHERYIRPPIKSYQF